MQSEPVVPNRRTVVFIDYQNMYRSARDAFGLHAENGLIGNIRPYSLGRQMVREPDWSLTQVRVYTGVHTPVGHAKLHAMMQRRMSSWIVGNDDKVEVFPRPLRYSGKGPREKGVDVETAIDFVRLALEDAFDVAVLASADTDLAPALQFVADKFPDKTLVTLGFVPDKDCQAPAPLDLASGDIERRFITRRDFERMRDDTDFYLSSEDRSSEVDPDRWKRIGKRLKS